jgi:predicted nucleic acid-binding Zn ribbon protein
MIEEGGANASAGAGDLPAASQAGAGQGVDQVPCPHCAKPIPEETIRCPHCREWIIDWPANEARRSPWFWPIVIAIAAAMILVVLAIRLGTR